MQIPFSNDNLTALMNRLDNEHNINLYKIVIFLERFYNHKKTNSCSQYYEEVFSFYQENLVKITKSSHYKDYINKHYNYPEIHPDKVTEVPKHVKMLDKFYELNQDEQKHFLKLAWFVLYCQLKKINPRDERSDFNIYYKLIEKIESLK
ncbi:MAG: hypothetical protein VKL41_08305 [Snowella sp.]|nr:hypothetical protein [Snowella sp.]